MLIAKLSTAVRAVKSLDKQLIDAYIRSACRLHRGNEFTSIAFPVNGVIHRMTLSAPSRPNAHRVIFA